MRVLFNQIYLSQKIFNYFPFKTRFCYVMEMTVFLGCQIKMPKYIQYSIQIMAANLY